MSETESLYRKLLVDRIVRESDSAKSFYLIPQDGKPIVPHQPGQHLPLRFHLPGREGALYRFYTISSFSPDQHYRLTVKREGPPPNVKDAPSGLSSSHLHDLIRVGDIIEAKPPAGNFFLDLKQNHPVVFIAGGIGMTPMISMITAMDQLQPNREIWFFLALRHGGDHSFKEHLMAIAARRPSVKLSILYDEPRSQDRLKQDYHRPGRVDVNLLRSVLPRLDMEYFICGPKPMMQGLVSGLQAAGVALPKLRTESFGSSGPTATLPPAAAKSPVVGNAWPITFKRSGKTVPWNPKTVCLWDFAQDNGVEIQYGCLHGDCGTCMTRLLEGEVVYNHPTMAVPDPGTCLPCSCKPKGPITLDV